MLRLAPEFIMVFVLPFFPTLLSMKTNSSQNYLPQKQQSWIHIPGGTVECTNCYRGRKGILSFQHSPLSKLQHHKTRGRMTAEWLWITSFALFLLISIILQMLTETYPRQASQNQSDQLFHVWKRRGTVTVPYVGAASIQNSPYRYTGINDIFTHAEEYAVEMISKFDRLVTNKHRRDRRTSFISDLWYTPRQKTFSTVK